MSVDRQTGRWTGITAMGFFGIGMAVLFRSPGLLLASVVSVGYAAYARSGSAPAMDLEIDRTLSEPNPEPGDTVEVRTTVRNVGEHDIHDLRIVDGVPDSLAVTAGASRAYTALGPAEEVTLVYEVEASHGTHDWKPVTVLGRDTSGAVEREERVAGPVTVLSAMPRLDDAGELPLGSVTNPYAGTVTSQVPGPGSEFHSTREYRPGDSLSRVDWNRFAQTGELATIEFNTERMATVVIVVDVRSRAYAATPGDAAHAVEHCIDAANSLLGSMLSGGNQVGLAALGLSVSYLAPGLGRAHRVRAREFLANELSGSPPEEATQPQQLNELRQRLAGDVQVVWVSPLVDDFAVGIPRTLLIDGHAVSVVSPDVTLTDTPGRQLASAERKTRLTILREANIRVVDWAPDQHLAAAIATAQRGWA